jgi:hypothetical protein
MLRHPHLNRIAVSDRRGMRTTRATGEHTTYTHTSHRQARGSGDRGHRPNVPQLKVKLDRMAYGQTAKSLCRLRLRSLIEWIFAGTQGYRVTSTGLRIALFWTRQ